MPTFRSLPTTPDSYDSSESWRKRNEERNSTYDATARDTRPLSAQEQGQIYAREKQDFQAGVASVTKPQAASATRVPTLPDSEAPAAPGPDQARFGVMRRGGIDPATGNEYGFVGVGAGGQGNQTFNSYEGAREFSQGTQAKAGTSLPYLPPAASEQRGFSQDGQRDVQWMRDDVAPAATAVPSAPAPARQVATAVPAPAAPRGTVPMGLPNINGAPMQRPSVAEAGILANQTRPLPSVNGQAFQRPVLPEPTPVPTPVNSSAPAGFVRRSNGTMADTRTVGQGGGATKRLIKGSVLDTLSQPQIHRRDVRQRAKPFTMPDLDAGSVPDLGDEPEPFDFPSSLSPTGTSRPRASLA